MDSRHVTTTGNPEWTVTEFDSRDGSKLGEVVVKMIAFMDGQQVLEAVDGSGRRFIPIPRRLRMKGVVEVKTHAGKLALVTAAGHRKMEA